MADSPKSSGGKKRRPFTGVALWIIIALLLGMAMFSLFGRDGYQQIDTQQGLELLAGDTVEQVKITGGNQQRVDLVLTEDFVDGEENKGTEVRFPYVDARGDAIVQAVEENAPAKGYTDEIATSSWWSTLLLSFLPLLIFIGLFWFLIMNAQGGGKAMQFGKSKAKLFNKEAPKVTFADVAGADEAVEELDEIKQFLVDPGRYQAVGAKIPKGVLLYGPPGTGKTLLAKAVAGEANVPFYSISGSDFVEMFVGVGASRVRDLFNTAKENALAITSSTIDAVGRHRGAGMGGGHTSASRPEPDAGEMDGSRRTRTSPHAATNRVDIWTLRAALGPLRPPDRGTPRPQGPPASRRARHVPLAHASTSRPSLRHRHVRCGLANAQRGGAAHRPPGNDHRQPRLTRRSTAFHGPQRYQGDDRRERQMTAYHEGGHVLVAAR